MDPIDILNGMEPVDPTYFNLQLLADRIVVAAKEDLVNRGLFGRDDRFIETAIGIDRDTMTPYLKLVVSEPRYGRLSPILTIRGRSPVSLFSQENRVKLYMVMA